MRLPVIALFVTIVTTAVHAETASSSLTFSDEQVRRVLLLALDNMTRARCEGSQACAAATDHERSNPPLTVAEARAIMHRGILSAAGERCGLDWGKRNFEPMMAYWRQQKKNERQMALIALVHGVMQGIAWPKDSKPPCPDEMRSKMDSQLTFRP